MFNKRSRLLFVFCFALASAFAQESGFITPETIVVSKSKNQQNKLYMISALEDSLAEKQNLLTLGPQNQANTDDSAQASMLFAAKQKYINQFGYFAPTYKDQPVPPVISKTYIAQPPSPNYTPNDNSIAVSNSGILISCINSSYYIYDKNGVNLKKGSFNTLLANPKLMGSVFYDPRVLYDPIKDRFFMIVLYGQSPANSHVVIAASKTNDPIGLWNIYILEGGFGNSTLWTDYPQVGISKEELFVTGNLFDPNNNFSDAIVLQINKESALSGQTLDYKLWGNINLKPFSLSPAPAADESQMDEGMRFVCNDASGGSKVYLFRITQGKDNSPQMVSSYISITAYDKPPNALQKGTQNILDQGGCRIKNAYLKDGLIHTVFAKSTKNGFGSIVYIRFDMDNLLFQRSDIEEDGLDFAFPSVAPASNRINNRLSYINFLVSGKDRFPESRIVSCDQSMLFSPTVLIKAGDNYIDVLQSETERWGDYTTILKTYEKDKINIWTAGSFGANGNRLGNVISYYSVLSDSAYSYASNFSIDIYPNPAANSIHISYQIPYSIHMWLDIIAMSGVMQPSMAEVIELRSYNQTMSYNIESFSPGVYEFVFRNNEALYKRIKVVVLPQN